MRTSVLIVDAAAARAAFARVSRIDEYHRNSGALRFVGDKLAQLPEGPITQACSSTTAGRNPATNVGQIFQPNRATGALRGLDKLLRNYVVFVLLKSPLLTGEYLKTTFRSLRAFALKASSTARVIGANLFNGLSRMPLAVAIRRNIRDAEIDPECLKGVNQLWIVDVANTGKVELTPHVHQIDLTLAKREHIPLMLARHRLDFDTSFKGPDRNNVVRFEADYPVIVWLRRVFAERDLSLLPIGFLGRIGVGNFGNAAHCRLRTQIETFSRLGVGEFVQVKLPSRVRLKAFCREEITSLVATLKRGAKQVCLLTRWLKLDVGDEFHVANIAFKYRNAKPNHLTKGRGFLCQLKQAVSAARFL